MKRKYSAPTTEEQAQDARIASFALLHGVSFQVLRDEWLLYLQGLQSDRKMSQSKRKLVKSTWLLGKARAFNCHAQEGHCFANAESHTPTATKRGQLEDHETDQAIAELARNLGGVC
jgi:hypothetical protein